MCGLFFFWGGGIVASSSGGASVFGTGLGLSVLWREARPGCHPVAELDQ